MVITTQPRAQDQENVPDTPLPWWSQPNFPRLSQSNHRLHHPRLWMGPMNVGHTPHTPSLVYFGSFSLLPTRSFKYVILSPHPFRVYFLLDQPCPYFLFLQSIVVCGFI